VNEAEFDRFADEYEASLDDVVRLSGESTDFFARQKVATVARVLDKVAPQPSVILDFGAGVGGSVPHFEACFPAAQIVCAEVSSRSIALANKRFGVRADFKQITADTLPVPDQSADLLFAACVFHHIPHGEHGRWLEQLYAVARPGARLFVFEHNPYNPLTRKTVNACEFDANAELIKPAALVSALREAGWAEARSQYTLFFPAMLSALRPLEPWLGWLPLGAQYYATGVRL